jgi:signal peptidase I
MQPTEPTKLKSINYIGPSMNPTLKPGDRLHIIPCDGQKIRRGDVVVFTHPREGSKIIHRVVSIHSQGIKTRGDNNNELDQWVLKPDQILGRVVSAKREKKQRRIFGGLLGQLLAVSIRANNVMNSIASSLLRPTYQRLVRSGILRAWLPAKMKPRVVSFDRAAGTELQLLMGRQVVGRWPPERTGWYIRRPFRLFVDEESLPENKGKGFRCQ